MWKYITSKLYKIIIKKNNIDESEVKEIVDEICGRNKKGEFHE